ncbi:hypothetical protein FZD47_12915 [Bacillus infantis]|uniref:Uncharacterized protein n=1 Tax=Bacillus infantis TaxID=324767 RepID=A0A5D4SM79_9BACI|nr:hypothetical protein [Bacillus infantis]TYS64360.1 hypothetical protein FZD47_12915 [Bacillus infantis]
MLHNSFLITSKNLPIKLNKQQKAALTRLFKLLKPGQYVYPGVLIRELNVDMRVAYQILDLLKENGYLKELYEVYCPYESKSIGKIYDNLLDLLGDDLEQDCPECGQTINIQKNNLLIYRIIQQVEIAYDEQI